MTVAVSRGTSDEKIDNVKEALQRYESDNPQANINLYRQNSVSIRIKIIDPSLAGLDRPSRHAKVWKYLDVLSEETQGDISMLVLLTPEEMPSSLANLEFDDPTLSRQ